MAVVVSPTGLWPKDVATPVGDVAVASHPAAVYVYVVVKAATVGCRTICVAVTR
jgi:hypothetical protein